MSEWLDFVLEVISDPKFSNSVRTVMAILGIPTVIIGARALWRWINNTSTDSKVDGISEIIQKGLPPAVHLLELNKLRDKIKPLIIDYEHDVAEALTGENKEGGKALLIKASLTAFKIGSAFELYSHLFGSARASSILQRLSEARANSSYDDENISIDIMSLYDIPQQIEAEVNEEIDRAKVKLGQRSVASP